MLVLLTFATSAFPGTLSTEIDNLEKAMEDIENKLDIEIANLGTIYAHMWDLRHEWGHADDALRDAGINALSDVAQFDVINIMVNLWKIAGQTANQIDKKRSINSYMSEAIGIFMNQLWTVYNLEGDYYIAWMNASSAVTQHNGNHLSPSETDHNVPVYHTHKYPTDTPTFPCPECDVVYLSVISPHQTKCGISDDTDVKGCGHIYYTCQPNDVKRHAPKYCGKDVWISSTYRPNKKLGVCGSGYRKCTSSKRDHNYVYEIVFRNGGSYISGYNPLFSWQTKCGNGTSNVPSGAVQRPGMDIGDQIDQSPSCYTCLDGSDYCPNASSH